MEKRTLGSSNLGMSAIGLGYMGMSYSYAPLSREAPPRVRAALCGRHIDGNHSD